MSRPSGGCAKVSKKVVPYEIRDWIAASDWRAFEKIVDKPISISVRETIQLSTTCYVSFSALHSKDQTLNSASAVRELNSWTKNSRKFLLSIGLQSSVKKRDRDEIIRDLRKLDKNRRLIAAPSLVFFEHLLQIAISAAVQSISEIETRAFSSKLKGDLWLIWVQLIAKSLAEIGVSPTASSANKANESKFVSLILQIQDRLPPYCARYHGYESIAKGVQQSNRQFAASDPVALHMRLVGFGSGVIGPYDAIGDAHTLLEILNNAEIWARMKMGKSPLNPPASSDAGLVT